ncbi:type II toxin-antitoxin system VapC family toxin [Gluconobacter cerinus]|nr:type II toxin-antitoxin system VapC family toxin [Gluconobacter cerinus]MBS1046601.1 type II toxin-antitoxin system VapC family toxin [Gluconobacter cerinus]
MRNRVFRTFQLLYGAERSSDRVRSRRKVERFVARLAVLPFDSEAAAYTADIRAALERNGRIIGPYDLMIAGHARSGG